MNREEKLYFIENKLNHTHPETLKTAALSSVWNCPHKEIRIMVTYPMVHPDTNAHYLQHEEISIKTGDLINYVLNNFLNRR